MILSGRGQLARDTNPVWPDSGRGSEAQAVLTIQEVPSSLGSGARAHAVLPPLSALGEVLPPSALSALGEVLPPSARRVGCDAHALISQSVLVKWP